MHARTHHRWWSIGLIGLLVILALLVVGLAVAVAQGPAREAPAEPGGGAASASGHALAARALVTPTTVITVTSGTDPDDSGSRTCYTDPVGPPGPPTSPCTLRRAIVEANALGAAERPILISFDIPQDPAEGYDSTLGIWKIELFNTTDTLALGRLKDGQIMIDGTTQPGGRSDGPKIILLGPGTGQKDGFVVGDIAGDNANEIRGLGFQNFKTHLYVNTDDNIIEGNWFGLADDGTGPYVRNDNPEDGSGNTGISFNGDPTNNLVQNNVFLGLDGVAVAIRGDDNVFQDNLVGTQADGSVPKQTDPNLICTTVDWLGGGGISLDGTGHRVENNVFAGLRQEIFQLSNQPEAIRAAGDDHILHNNMIGVDATDTEVGVCGRGIYLMGANHPEFVQVISNTIVNPEMSGISVNGALADANTLRRNVIKKTRQWPAIEGNPEPEDAIQMGPSIPDALKDFEPAAVTSINGTSVQGSSGANSPCPDCIIELFLDDTDLITEALQSLVVVTATSSGDWTATLPFELAADQGLRTTSTSARFNTIANMNAGTTTKLSMLYGVGYEVFLPLVVR